MENFILSVCLFFSLYFVFFRFVCSKRLWVRHPAWWSEIEKRFGVLKKMAKKHENGEEANPEMRERKRVKREAFANNLIVSESRAKVEVPLSPSKIVIKHHGKDILKKSQRKNKFLFSFPGLLAPLASGGKIGELKDLGTKNPILYLHFPQGQIKLFGTILYPKNRYLTLQFPRGGKNVTCEDYFDNMIVFSQAWWIGTKDENPEESRLDFPQEFNEVWFP